MELINTSHVADHDDALLDERADDWLRRWTSPNHEASRATPPGGQADDLSNLRRFREALRQFARANNGQTPDEATVAQASEALTGVALVLELPRHGSTSTPGLSASSPSAAAEVLAAAITAYLAEVAAGTWPRLKACANDECQWAYFDSSRNGSRRWCDMADCGNLAKQRRFRERRKA